MRFAPFIAIALVACKGDVTVVEAENDPPTINATVLGGPFLVGEDITVQAIANDPDPNQDWTELGVTIDIEGAVLADGDPTEVDGGGQWSFTFPATEDLTTATVTATDSFDASASDTVSIALAENAPPTLSFDTPVADARFAEGSSVLVEISVTDAEDREQDLILTWSGLDDLSAAPTAPDASGYASFTATGLANGTYTLSATVEDSAGDQVTRTRTFSLVDPDVDGDGDLATEFGGTDCDDNEAAVNGSGTEICDDLDNDCDNATDEEATDADTWYTDADSDTYGDPATAEVACDQPGNKITQGGDCDDSENTVYPGNPEVCDGLDNDCLNGIDDGLAVSNFFYDGDGDDYGAGSPVSACIAPADHVSVDGDCNDGDASINPGVTVDDCDTVNNDCDNATDEDEPPTEWYLDSDGDTYGIAGTTSTACYQPANYAAVAGDCDDNEIAVNPGATETCNGINDDCNNGVDEGFATSDWFYDGDGDGYGTGTPTNACQGPSVDWKADGGDCDDGDASVNPGVTVDDCDEINNDCDNATDEDEPPSTWYLDSDGDNYGIAGTTSTACYEPANYADVAGDCDDNEIAVNPGATETCNGVNDDCNNGIDEGFATSDWFYDGDGDGYGTGTPTNACAAPSAAWKSDGGDCNDSNTGVNPGIAVDDCNGVDNDCDTDTDEDEPPTQWWFDFDGDRQGDSTDTQVACDQPVDYVNNSDDCDDDDALRYTGADELCDGYDNDCDPNVDEGLSTSTFYYDADGDGVGGNTSVDTCAAPAFHVADTGDCDDNESMETPGGTEICGDGYDNDCVGGDESCGPDYTGTWLLYEPGTNNRLTVAYGCDGWNFAFDYVVINDNSPSIEVIAGGTPGASRVNGCEPGWEAFCTDLTGMDGNFQSTGSPNWVATDALEPLFGSGYAELYYWEDQAHTGGWATFTDDTTFLSSFGWYFEERGNPIPATCNPGYVEVEGRKQ